ncbi:MAG TPA: helix-turn-helix domain-containing protein [Anaeromyxobacteraceae bacterium]|nr:helix-turn-helix domain-containing protein [Anaeromyxobacteraceae bacterium]
MAERLAQLLLTMTDHHRMGTRSGLLVGRPWTRDELAKMVGATRQWVSMTLERFCDEGLIGVRGHRIVVLDEARQRGLAR